MGVERRGVHVYVCGMFETNPKLDIKPNTRNQEIVGWALISIVVCVCVCVECSKQTQNLEIKLRQTTHRWNRHGSYIVNILFLNYLMQNFS